MIESISFAQKHTDKKLRFLLIGGGVLEDELRLKLTQLNSLPFYISGNVSYSQFLSYIEKCDICLNIFKENALISMSYKLYDYFACKSFVMNNLVGDADEIINEFLKQTKGKIVNYNPIVIEYLENNKFIDPYLGYDAYLYKCKITFTKLDNINKEEYYFIDEDKVQKRNVDTVLFSKRNSSKRFMFKGKIVFDSGIGQNYFQIQLERKYIDGVFVTPLSTRDFQGDGNSSIDYGFPMWADSCWGDFFDFKSYLEALKCERINFN
jgi:hypothetical protein